MQRAETKKAVFVDIKISCRTTAPSRCEGQGGVETVTTSIKVTRKLKGYWSKTIDGVLQHGFDGQAV